MNWLTFAAGSLQILAFFYGTFTGLSWRVNLINGLVGIANILLAGAR